MLKAVRKSIARNAFVLVVFFVVAWGGGYRLVYAQGEMDFLKSIELDSVDREQEPSSINYKAYLQQRVKYGWQSPPSNFERNRSGLSQVQTHLYAEARGNFNKSAQWVGSVKSEYEWLRWQENNSDWYGHSTSFIKDLYIDVSYENGAWLRLGNQVVAWGESESLTITDVISPMDQREPGQTQLSDSREQVPALFGSLAVSKHINLSSVITYRAGTHRYASPIEPFDIQGSILPSGYRLKYSDVDSDWELASRMDIKLQGSDISVIVARVNDNTPALDYTEIVSQSVVLFQQRFNVYGVNANRTLFGGVMRGEMAYWKDALQPVLYLNAIEESNQLRSMLGYDYAISDRWYVSLEINNTHLSKVLKTSARGHISSTDHFGYALRIQNSVFNERLVNQLWVMKLGIEDAHIARWSMDYDWSDHWSLGLAMVIYKFGNRESMLNTISNHDSVNAQLTFSI